MKKLKITVLGKTYEVLVEDMGEVAAEQQPVYAERAATPPTVPLAPIERSTSTPVSAPMSGTVVKIAVSKGDTVSVNDTLLTLEAMKMQNAIPSPKDGIVREILVHVGDSVSSGAVMLIID